MTIRVYDGIGSSRNGTPILIEELARHVARPVAGISDDEMRRSDSWIKDTSLLVFAGKSVTGFKEALGERLLETIRTSVEQGVFDYMGICAGAAFASAKIKYRMQPVNDPDKRLVLENTGLSMFNGLASGPARSVSPLAFSGGSENLSLIWLRSTQDFQSYNSFYWGGPALIPLEKIQASEGRALSFLQGDELPMSLRLKFGQGHVTLCSHHPEINAGNVGRWAEARYVPTHEARRLEYLASHLDGTAMRRFLSDAELISPSSAIKMAAKAATFG